MKLLASLLTMIALTAGVVTASTAYAPLVSSVKEADQLILSAPAGLETSNDPTVEPKPLVMPGTEVTQEVIDKLTAAKVDRIRVKQFAWGRWSERWFFVLAVLGFIGAAVLSRIGREDLAADAKAEGSPQVALQELCAGTEKLHAEVAPLDRDEQLDRIVSGVEELQRQHTQTFVDGRDRLISEYGMGRFAQLMDRFAAAERQLNRAWSAAADQYAQEAVECLATAKQRLDEAVQKIS